jgi:hypothetical protein
VSGLRVYEWNRFQSAMGFSTPPAGFGIFCQGQGPPTTSDSWLARVILHASWTADAIMGGTPAINENGFNELEVVFTTCWSDDTLTPQLIADPSLGGDTLLSAVTMKPTITKHWTNANELLVRWDQQFVCDTSVNRVWPFGIGASPSVNVGLWFVDPAGLTRHTVPFPINWYGTIWLETLWWHRP